MSWQLKGTGVMMLGLVMAGLAGCGGGGSGGGNGLGTTVPQQPIKITQANAVAVAGVVLEAVLFDDINPGSIVGTASVTTRNPTPRSRRFDLAGVMRAQLKRFPMLATQTGVRIAVVIPPTQLPCAVSGTVIISGEIADPTGETLSPGDTLQGTYDNCNEGDGVVVSGKMLFVVQSISGDLDVPPYDYTVTVTFSNLSFSDTVSGERLTLSGNSTFREATDDGILFAGRLSGSSLNFSDSGGDSGIVSDYVWDNTSDINTLEYTINSDGTLATVNLGGSVQYATQVTFEGIGSDFPSLGTLLISGDSSSETVTAVDSVAIAIEVDEDGDGTTDVTIDTTWDAL